MSEESQTDFGPLLRRAREKRGVSLQQVAATTKISARVLEALERNDISKLPGGIFSRAFVRAYTREVGLDPEETVNRFVAAFPPDSDEAAPTAAARSVDAEGFESGRRAALTLFQILGLSILVVIIAVVYTNLRPSPQAPVELPRVAPQTSSAQAPTTAMPVPPPAGAPDESPTTPPVVAPAAAPAATAPGGLAARTGGSPGQGSAVTTTEGVTPTEPIAPTVDEPIAVSILAREECWLSLSIDGQKVIGRNLQPGERVQYRAKRAADVSLGNAGAIDLMINGKPAKPLGARGQVVTKTITAETIKSLIQ